MSDSKWERLIDCLTDTFPDGIHVTYKLIHNETIYWTAFVTSDFKPFFEEPTLYKEVEWIEFPHKYEDYVDVNNHKAGKRLYDQDVCAIEREIQRIGSFELQHLPTGLRLHAYK
ncbi:MAG: hypothetical protein RL088_3935 [Verrucomicrobiota bacterium]